jgi:hypothetical protein
VISGLILPGLPAPVCAAEVTVRIPPMETTLTVEGQALVVPISGTISAATPVDGRQTFQIEVDAGLADLQSKMTAILRTQLNQDNRCGERLSVEQATLVPAHERKDAEAVLTVNLHFEKWGCAKAFGKEIAKKLIGGNGVIQAGLTPETEESGAVRLNADVISANADGQLGEALRSGSFGEALQEKIRTAVVKSIEKAADFKSGLPPAVQQILSIQSAHFLDGGDGRLALRVTGHAQLPAEQAQVLLNRLVPK